MVSDGHTWTQLVTPIPDSTIDLTELWFSFEFEESVPHFHFTLNPYRRPVHHHNNKTSPYSLLEVCLFKAELQVITNAQVLAARWENWAIDNHGGSLLSFILHPMWQKCPGILHYVVVIYSIQRCVIDEVRGIPPNIISSDNIKRFLMLCDSQLFDIDWKVVACREKCFMRLDH